MTIRREGQTLSDEMAGLLRKLHRDGENAKLNWTLLTLRKAGWTNRAMGRALGVSGESVRIRIGNARPCGYSIEVLPPPVRLRTPRRARKPPLTPEPQALRRLLELKPIAATVTGGMAPDDPRRKASEQYSALLAEQVARGVTLYRLAQILGTRHAVLSHRLSRHGYRTASPSRADQTHGTGGR